MKVENQDIKLIRSSTMKCLLCNKVRSGYLEEKKPAKVLAKRKESLGELLVMDDFSLNVRKRAARKREDIWFRTPLIVRWDLSYRCNYRCRHCYSDCGEAENGITTAEAKKVLDILDKGNVQLVQILGGEPFMRSDILEIVDYALSKKFIFALNTNGSMIDAAMAKKLGKMGLKYLQISIHGKRDSHDWLTNRQGSFEKAALAIKKLLKNRVNVSVSCVAHDGNCIEIPDFITEMIALGVHNIQILTPLDEGRAIESAISLSDANAKTLKQKLLQLKNTNKDLNLDLPGFDIDLIDGLVNQFSKDEGFEFFFGCIGGVSGIRIDPCANACICVGKMNKSFGNLLKEDLSVIMKRMYAWRLNNRPKYCEGCDAYLSDCQGACYLRFK